MLTSSLWLTSLASLAGVIDARNLVARQAAPSSSSTPTSSSSLLVSANVGTFQGTLVQPGVRQWLGIRYGAPTNGSLRFRPPQRAKILPSNQVFNATTYSPSCPQNRGANFVGFNIIQNLGNATDGEDCLSLNIWSPSAARLNASSSGTAVMIWIYGGAFTFGSSNTPGYQGDNIVRDNPDVTVVTINYRTNAFGFPAGAPGLNPYETNLGLSDQRMAIEWVYNNIRSFGGDPERIVLFGESAGASSIGAYPYTYEFDPIVKGLIMQSGSEYLMATEAVSNTTAATEGWNYMAARAGCAYNSTTNSTTDTMAAARQLTCLQALDFTVIQRVVSNYTLSGTAFAPRPNNISVFNGAGYTARAAQGRFAKLPVLIGNNDNEGTILTALSPGISPDLITKYGFTCPAASVATSRQNFSVPSWQYRYLGEWPDINAFPALGVFHSSEIGLVFGTYNLSTSAPSTTQEVLFSRQMQGGWVAFARDPQRGLTNYGWPVYQANGTTLIQLAKNNQSTTTFNSSQAYNSGCAGVSVM
ncbi:protein of unknown function [Taphrina deformans PYCC 5710]|uniref:Carboxylic ester hydrolase n=1 Tax=Taphrina deformans (strain PYCC 5710 / ATCC 11124 / CBS 356.35 / IMI 108563 / JCM 9778 / NBRC 8474) TaxID=1097556 RepID=R4XMV5_TAPDE|nr:protein of unknown function [Taphrina deformans PYCC 5710]|eukprot:CCG84624.1 protein of unknown function [Taphrina deformans PYCC 5710]